MEQNENKRDGDEIHTGGGASVGGDARTGRDFVGRDVFNQYYPPYPEPPKPGELMADAASELWKAITELNKIIGGFAISVADNTRATERQAQSIDTLARTTEHQSAAIDNLAKKTDQLSQTTDQLSQTTKQQGERSEAEYKKFAAQITTLQRVAIALRPLGIQVPDIPEGQIPPLPVRQSPWWQPYATPVLLALILIVLVVGLGVFGGGP